jgi:phage shock protein C
MLRLLSVTKKGSLMSTDKKLNRSKTDKVIAGVCGGLADYFGFSSAIVRLVFIILLFAYGGALVAYIILWVVMPKAPVATQTSEKKADAAPKDHD